MPTTGSLSVHSELSVANAAESKGIGDIAIWDLLGFGLVFSACFFNLVALNSDKDEIQLDAQVWLKLAIVAGCGLYGTMGMLTDSRVRRVVRSFPVVCILAIFCLYSLSSLFAFEPAQAMASSFSILAVYLATITTVCSIGQIRTLKAAFWGSGLFVIGSWMVYLLVPEIGVIQEAIPGGNYVERMGGLSHPNTLGQCAGLCTVMGLGLYFFYGQKKKLTIILVLFAIAALIQCYSRTAIAGTVIAVAVGMRHLIWRRQNLSWILGSIAIGIAGLMLASTQTDFERTIDESMKKFSKSGDSEEITSATGRGEIWAKSIRLIGKKPAIGYGPTSSKFLLEDYSLYTHNLWLNVGLSCGILGLIVAVLMCVSRFAMLFSSHSFVADGLFMFIFINGLFENVIFSNICGLPTICWILALSWFHYDEDRSTEHE